MPPDAKPLFSIRNRHISSSGEPPSVTGDDPNLYVGYFENELREQAVFVYDRRKREGTLYLGDAGWEHPHRVVAPGLPLGGLILQGAERAWLAACWKAAGGDK